MAGHHRCGTIRSKRFSSVAERVSATSNIDGGYREPCRGGACCRLRYRQLTARHRDPLEALELFLAECVGRPSVGRCRNFLMADVRGLHVVSCTQLSRVAKRIVEPCKHLLWFFDHNPSGRRRR